MNKDNKLKVIIKLMRKPVQVIESVQWFEIEELEVEGKAEDVLKVLRGIMADV